MGNNGYDCMTVVDVIHAVIAKPSVNPKRIAAALGCHVTTVYQMGEYDDRGNPRHVIKAHQVPVFCRAADDCDLLRFLEWQAGMPDTNTRRPTDMEVIDEATDVLKALSSAFRDGRVSRIEAKVIERELQELNQIVVGRLANAEADRANRSSGAAVDLDAHRKSRI